MKIPINHPLTHPGEMLREEFLEPLGLTQQCLAELLSVSYTRVNELINGKRGITPDTALRLSKLFNTTPDFWLNGQLAWDLYHTMNSISSHELKRIKPFVQS